MKNPIEVISHKLKSRTEYYQWLVNPDVEVMKEVIYKDGKPVVTGFKFYVKEPFGKIYKYHEPIALENLAALIKMVQKSIRDKTNLDVIISLANGAVEHITIHKKVLHKALDQLRSLAMKAF